MSARSNLEAFVDCSVIESRANERRGGDEMVSERYNEVMALCWIVKGCRLPMIDNNNRCIRLVEAMGFQIDDRADQRGLE